MNFVKRAGLSLWSRKARTLITLGTFLVIAVVVLAGILISGATARAEQDARRSVGAEVDLGMDLSQLAAGGGLQAPHIDAATVDKLGALPGVQKYTYSMWDRVILGGSLSLVTGGVPDSMGPGGTPGVGVLDSGLLPDFRSGKSTLVSGRHLTAADRDKKLVLIEQRLAAANHLKVGDPMKLTGNDGKTTADFTVAGVYHDPRPGTQPDAEYGVNPANLVYGTVGGFTSLDPTATGALQVGKASFLLQDAADEGRFKDAATKAAGSSLAGFKLDVNDKAIQQMTGPLGSIRSTAVLAMWLVGVAGAAILALVVVLAVRQRRREYGVLLAMGEKKSRLIAQQALEIVGVAALAVALGAMSAPRLTQNLAQSMLSSQAADARHKIDSWRPPPPGSTGLDQGADPNDRPVDDAAPIDRITVRLDPADLAGIGGVGLGVAALATAIPAASVLRLSPRTILTKGN